MYFFNLFSVGLCIDEPEHDAGFVDSSIGTGDADFLNLVGGLSDAGCIDKTEGDAIDVDGVLDGVARGAMNVGHDGAIVLQEGIQQGRFTYIGLAYNGYRNALLQGLAHLETMSKTSDVFVN